MIVRMWRGATSGEKAEAYLDYLEQTGLKSYRKTPGNLAALALQRSQGERAEFRLISIWESWEAVRQFAGSTPERAVFYPEDDRCLVRADEHVDHFDVVFSSFSDRLRELGGDAASEY